MIDSRRRIDIPAIPLHGNKKTHTGSLQEPKIGSRPRGFFNGTKRIDKLLSGSIGEISSVRKFVDGMIKK